MKNLAKIHVNKQPVRRHFIKEWAEARNLKARDLVKALDVDKSQVYRWYKGQLPHPDMQVRLANLLKIEPEALLRHPDDDWLARFFKQRSDDERTRAKEILEAAFPPNRTGTDG